MSVENIHSTTHPAFEYPVAFDGESASSHSTQRRAADAVGLTLEQITLSFGGITALKDVSLDVQPREIRAIIGPNGAGKTSLLNVISGIYAPNRGSIALADRSFRRVPAHKLARLGIARTFQNLSLFKGLTVFDNVAIARVKSDRSTFIEQVVDLGRAKRQRIETRDRAYHVIRFLGLDGYQNRLVGTLPYGLQKRVDLARALVAEPDILLLDEPMAGMTPVDKVEMTTFIREARDRFHATVVLIEHDIGVVMGLSDRVAVLDYGRKIADGTPAEVRSDKAVIEAYMGVAHATPTLEGH